MKPLDLSVYLVTDHDQSRAAGRDLVDTVLAAVEGGVTVVQVRGKHLSARDLLALTIRLGDVLPEDVPLLVNDRVDVYVAARSLGGRVDGVHVGQDDLPVVTVRRMIGPEAVLGLSTSTVPQVAEASDCAVVDYVGIGVVRETTTKTDAPAPLGLDGVGALAAHTALPAVAIGGIRAADFAPLRRHGLAGAAVVSEVCAATDPRGAAMACALSWQEGRS